MQKQIGFVLIKPDAILRGLSIPLLQELSSRGIVVFRHKVVTLDHFMLNELYDTTKAKYKDWWVMEEAYSIGPVVACLVYGSSNTFQTTAEWIRDIIGPTDPLKGRSDQLRASFKGTHRIFNLIHASEDSSRVRHEANVVFNTEEIDDKHFESLPQVRLENIESTIADLTQFTIDTNSNSFNLNQLRFQLKSKLWGHNLITDKVRTSTTAKTCLAKLMSLAQLEEAVLEDNRPLTEELAALHPLLSQQRMYANLLVRCLINENVFEPELSDWNRLLNCLLEKDAYFSNAFDKIESDFQNFGIHLNKLQRIILLTEWIGEFSSHYKEKINSI